MEKEETVKQAKVLWKQGIAEALFRLLVVALIAIPIVVLFVVLQRPFSLASLLLGTCAVLLLLPVALVTPLRWLRPPTSALMVQERFGLGEIRRAQGKIIYQWTPIEQMPRDLLLATLIAEDPSFLQHFGFDFESVRQAHEYNKTHAQKRGGSTITQQTAKNLFLWPDRSYLRKAIESYFTILMEGLWPKRRILEIYLNIARFDLELFGAGAAAQMLLRKPVSQLSRQEAALMAAVIVAPLHYRLIAPDAPVRYRQTMILARMKQVGVDYLGFL